MTKTIYRLKLGRGRGCAQAFGIFKWHFLIIARMQHQGRSARSLKQITAGKVSELTLRQPLKPPFKGLQGGWRQGLLVAKAACYFRKSIRHPDEYIGFERKRSRHGTPAFAGDQQRQAADRVTDGKPNWPQGTCCFTHRMGAVHEARPVA